MAHRLAASLTDARFVELADRFAHAVSVFASEVDRRSATVAG